MSVMMSPEEILEEMKEFEQDEEEIKKDDTENSEEETKGEQQEIFATLIEQRDNPRELLDNGLIDMVDETVR